MPQDRLLSRLRRFLGQDAAPLAEPQSATVGNGGDAPTVASNLLLALLFLSCWIWPNWLSADQVQSLCLLTQAEMMLVMMSFFLVPLILVDVDRKLQRLIIGFILLFFGLFIAGMSIGVGAYSSFFFFAYAAFTKFMAIRRLRGAASLPWAVGIDWIGSTVILLLTCIVALGLPMPEFGMGEGAAYFDKSTAERLDIQVDFGVYEDEPERGMAFGVVFYSLQAWAQRLKTKWAERRFRI